MIRHENHPLVLIGEHETDNVIPRVFTVLCADSQEALVHEVWVSDTDMRYLLNPDDVVHVQGIKADKRKIQLLHVKHVEYVIESEEELIRGEAVDVRCSLFDCRSIDALPRAPLAQNCRRPPP